MTELLAVKDKLNVSVRELSLGERMKMELIASLLHQPKVLLLDEPTIGLDVTSQKTVRDFIRRHNAQQKTTIILTSHYMADIQALCERVIIIDHGKLFFDGKLNEIVDRFADFKLITIQCENAESVVAQASHLCDENKNENENRNTQAGIPRHDLSRYGEVTEKTATAITLKVKRDRVIQVCKSLLDELPVTDIDIQEVPIEDVIRQIFADENRGKDAQAILF